MPNPTAIDRELVILAAATSERSVGLNAHREYSVINLAKGEDGSAVDADIYVATSLTPTLNAASGAGKFLLALNRVVVIGPGVTMLRFKAASGVPTLGIVPAPFDRLSAGGVVMPVIGVNGDCHDAEWNPIAGVLIAASGLGVIGAPSAYSGGDGFFYLEIEVENTYDFVLAAYLDGFAFLPPHYRYQNGVPDPNYAEFVVVTPAPPTTASPMLGREQMGTGLGQRGQRVG